MQQSSPQKQPVQSLAVNLGQAVVQLLIDTAVRTRDRFGASILDHIQTWLQDRSLPQHLNQRSGEHDSFVRLHRRLHQFLDGSR